MDLSHLLAWHRSQMVRAASKAMDGRASRHSRAHWEVTRDFHTSAVRALSAAGVKDDTSRFPELPGPPAALVAPDRH